MTPLRSLAKHSSIYSAGTVLGKAIAFVMIPVYTRYLTTADYGILEILVLVSSVTSMILSLKLSSGMVRHYFAFKNQDDRNRLVSSQFCLVGGIAAVAAAILFTQTGLLARLLFRDQAYAAHITLIFCAVFFEILNETSYAYLRIIEKSTLYVIFTTFHLIMGLCLNIVMIVVLGKGVLGVLYSMVISNGVISCLLLTYALRRVGLGFDIKKLRPVLRFSLPMLPAGVLMFILNMGDRFLLNHLRGPEEVGIYSLGYRFGMLLSLFVGSPFLQTWQYKRVEIYESGDRHDPLFSRVLIYLAMLLAILGLGVSLLIEEVLTIVATPSFRAASEFVPFVVGGYFCYILFYVFDIGIFLKKKTGWYVLINGVGAGVNIGLNLVLIPRYGAMGAAIATLISFSLCPVLAYIVSQHYLRVTYDFGRFAKVVGAAVALYFVGSTVPWGNRVVALLAHLILVLLYPVVLLLLGAFLPEETAAARRFFRRIPTVFRNTVGPRSRTIPEDIGGKREPRPRLQPATETITVQAPSQGPTPGRPGEGGER